MSALKKHLPKKEKEWTPVLIKMLRGKRTQTEFGKLLGAPKNTVWRWEAGRVKPDETYARRLSQLAEQERFLADWQLVGSMELAGDLEEASKKISEMFKKSLARTIKQLAG